MELNGKIVQVLPEQSGQGKNGEWVKHLFVVEWKDNGYTQHLCLEVVGADKWEKMHKAVVVGYDVLVKFSVASREWQGKWFTTANCYYCSNVGGQQQAQAPQQAPQQPVNAPQDDSPLPF